MSTLLSRSRSFFWLVCLLIASVANAATQVDLLIRNGVVYDGSGNAPVRGDVAVNDGRVVAVGALRDYTASRQLDAKGLAVAPGFINVLS